VVLRNPASVTDAAILAQLDTLNKSMAGANGDSVKIPAGFKPLFGRSGIQFCLAQRTPTGQNTSGIERISSTANFSNQNDFVKRASTGGADIWDQSRYFNVWVCELDNGILGYATFPNDGVPLEQGVVIDVRSLPGGSFRSYNAGKTLVHEVGHYFNLFHIWGTQDNQSCTDSDFVGDTPNQGNATAGGLSGIRTDNCTTSGSGIMYQNYMDYTNDSCLVLFTTQQVNRMENALADFRISLLNSNGCETVIDKNFNAQIVSINSPLPRICENTFIPVITLRNAGAQTLTSLVISASIDGGTPVVFNWTGSLARLTNINVTLTKLTTTTGRHTLTVYVSNPNNTADEFTANDTLRKNFQYFNPVDEVSEGFEGLLYPPAGWDVVNTDNEFTWERVTSAARSGIASASVNNFDYVRKGELDDLRLPTLELRNLDSAFLSFSVAASGNASAAQLGNQDTLEVIISTDCGATFTVLYQKWGDQLNTRSITASSPFTPVATEWRVDSLDLSDYINAGPFIIAFRSRNGYQNAIYIDDVNLRKVIVNPILKEQGILITPNPARNEVAVRFYPQPVTLQGIQLFNSKGQKLAERRVSNGATNNFYSFNMSGYAPGTYIVRVVFSDTVITRKIIKL
ncbi:MAG: T9SS type A sorting domain-containing protein, partial [Chitinophagaceae bacterium]|nr:T9SS type A sorting domain-containing protein [Chitinophagaceae bacterium]